MDYEQDDQTEGGLMTRIKESPRTVSALIIILIIAAAIYAFSGDKNQQPEEQANVENATVAVEDQAEGEEAIEEEIVDEGATSEVEVIEDETPAPEAIDQEALAAQEEQLPEASKTDEGYVEVANAGNGVTHLARRATTRYLSENSVGYAVTNEHRIYMEDYIKDRMGRAPLAIGEAKTITYDLVREAAEAAGRLNDNQLKNLTQYTYVLT